MIHNNNNAIYRVKYTEIDTENMIIENHTKQ